MKKTLINIVIAAVLGTFIFAGCTSKREEGQTSVSSKDISYQYTETKIDLPEDLSYVTSMAVTEENEILVAGTNADETNAFVWKKETSGQWEKKLDISVLLNEKGITYSENISTSISKSEDISIAIIMEDKIDIIILNEDGTIKREYRIEKNSFGDEVPASCKILNNNTILFSSSSGQLYIYQIEKNKVNALNAENEYNFAVNVLDKELYAFTTNGLKIINTDTLEKIENQKLATQLQNKMQDNGSFSIGIDITEENGKNNLYFADNHEISKLNGKEEVKLVDGSRTVLGDSKYVVQAIFAEENSIYALVINESNRTSLPELYQYNYDSTLEKTEKQLRIYVLEEDTDELEQIVNAYQRKYSDITITIETGLYGDSITMSDAIKQLNTEIAAGNGPDIIILDGMSVNNCIEKKLLMDISECVEQVSAEEELFLNIIDTYKNREEQYAVPLRFAPMYIVSNQQDMPSNSKQVAEYMKELSEQEKQKRVFDHYSYDQIVSILYRTNLSSLKENSMLENGNLEKFYTEIKKIYEMVDMSEVAKIEKKQLKYIKNTIWGYDDFNLVASNEISSSVDYFTCVESIYAAECLRKEGKIAYKYLENDNQEYYYVPTMIMGISAKSKNVEEAKKFITYALSTDSQKNALLNGLSINKTALKDILSSFEEKKYTTETDPHSTNGYNGESVTITLTPFTEEEITDIINNYENFKVSVKDDCNIRNIIMEQADNLVIGKISVDEAVENAKNSINIYLSE